MSNKNMILLIVGIILGVLVIGGGTFAYLQFSATIQNQSYSNVSTRNFTFTAPVGTSVTQLYPFPHQPSRAGVTPGNGYIVLNISKGADTPKASSLKIYAKFDTMQVNVANYIKVAICKSTTAGDCNNSTTDPIPSSTTSNWVVVNKSIANNTSEQLLFEDTSSTSSPFNVIGAASMTYYIYFWLNAEVVTNANAETLANSNVIGSVYFYATQGE